MIGTIATFRGFGGESKFVISPNKDVNVKIIKEAMGELLLKTPHSKNKFYGENDDSKLLKDKELILIKKVLDECNGNKTEAAEKLGMSRPTLYKKIRDLNS